MTGLKIAHVSDTHLGYRSATIPKRDEDFAKAWIQACGDIVDAKPDLVIHAGDVFHRPNPSWAALRDFLDGASILENANCPIVLISGNHDCTRLVTKHTVFSILTEVVPHITISYDARPIRVGPKGLKTEIVLLSHQALLSKTLEEDFESAWDSLLDARYYILVAHGDVGDLEESKEMGSTVIPDFVFQYPWDYVALGHLHTAQPFGPKGWYSGSIERCGWTDISAKPAWTLVELSEDKVLSHVQVPLAHMPMIELPDLDCDGSDDVDIAGEVLDALRRVKVPSERAAVRVKLLGVHLFARRSLQFSLQRIVREHYPKLIFQVAVESDGSIWAAPPDPAERKNIASTEDMFRDFVESRVLEGSVSKEDLLANGLEALAKAREAELERSLL